MTADELAVVAKYVGELWAAAKHDLETATPADVGLNGISIVGWRRAYLEGCKDMAEGIATRLPEAVREDFKRIVFDTASAELASLKANPPSPSPEG